MESLTLYVAIDLMSCVHPYYASHSHLPVAAMGKAVNEWVHFHMQPELWIPSGWNASGVEKIIPVLLVDQKNPKKKYWRHEYYADYKGKRKSHPTSLGWMRDEIMNTWQLAGGAVEIQPGFEADDFAGDLCRSIGASERVLLVSVDSDWSQLVSDRVVWLDTFSAMERKHRDQRPCVLDIQQVIKRWNSYPDHMGADREITNPREIADRKHLLGDTADAIPAGREVPIGIIDLYNPIYRPRPVDRSGYMSSAEIRLPIAQAKPFYCFRLRKWDDYVLDYAKMTVFEIPHRDM